jgi:solute carrier family 25 citrate transporter 1
LFLCLHSGFFDALLRIPREEGLMAMYKGLLPRLMRIAPGQAIVWTVNDQIVGYFEQHNAASAAAATTA